MIEIQNISWRNFMSYGDETSSLDLANMGQVLITGEIQDESTDGLRKSNGSGKSTIPNVILWVLFGRTMHSANPGDSVINHYTGAECWAKITFKNGDTITRTRGTKGHNELIYVKNSEEQSLSTNKNLQQLLNKELKLDWELFTNSAFFTQYGKSWLEMADNSRKKALERILKIDRFTFYAAAAKKNADDAEVKMSKYTTQIESRKRNIDNIKNTISRNDTLKLNYEASKEKRLQDIRNSVETAKAQLTSIELPNMEKIIKQWEIYNKIVDKIEENKNRKNDHIRTANLKSSTINDLKSKISNWQAKKGKQCLSCLQTIDENHIIQHIEPYELQCSEETEKLAELKQKISMLDDTINTVSDKLKEKRPKVTTQEAKAIYVQIDNINQSIKQNENHIIKVQNETNPYLESIEKSEQNIADEENEIQKLEELKQQQEFLYKHYNFIHKAYSDRSRIKSYVFREHIPFINNRLNHYLDMLNLHIKVNLTENLGLNSNLWGYDFQSGGERKRTDVAFMLAAFDFYELTYGRQSNILVLDEVDGRMDDDGIDGLINIIKQELASKVETILIISHRNQMHDVFDKEIHVTKANNCSRINIK